MKALPLFLFVSLAANGVMLAAWFSKRAVTPPAKITSGSESTSLSSAGKVSPAERGLSLHWEELRNLGTDDLITALLTAGVPERDAKSIAASRSNIGQTFLGRSGPGWEELRENPEFLADGRREFGNLSFDTLLSARRLKLESEELQGEIWARAGVGAARFTKEDRENMAAIERNYQAALTKLLTPEQYEQYQLRSSETAGYLREQLFAFRPSEEEYKALFGLYRTVDQAIPLYRSVDQEIPGAPSVEESDARKAGYDQLKPQIEALLGPARYAEYLEVHDHGSDKLNRLLVRLDLPLTTAHEVNTVRVDIMQRAAVIRADLRLAPADREARLATLAREATMKITAAMGAVGCDAYTQMKGDWIRALEKTSPEKLKP